jgi:hypothetical protein
MDREYLASAFYQGAISLGMPKAATSRNTSGAVDGATGRTMRNLGDSGCSGVHS